MSEKKRFEFLEHTADAYVAAYGRDLAEAFENAAYAMFEVMADIRRVVPRKEEPVQVSASDEYGLLYSWLEALLVRFDTEQTLYSKFKIERIDRGSDGLSLTARIWGEKFDAKRHAQRVGIKAITYHRMEIIREAEAVTLKFILDI